MNDEKKLTPGEETAEAIGRLKEAAHELREEAKDSEDVSAEEAGTILGAFLKGLWAVLK